MNLREKTAQRIWLNLKAIYSNGSGKFRTAENRSNDIMKRFSCIKAQSLTELAIFGGLLLLVLSYFVSWGIRLNYQQDVQMRAFRMALASVVTEGELRPDAEATVAVIEDKLVPDPRNMVGKGDLITVSGQGNVIWGNQMQRPMSSDPYDMPRLKYLINGVERNYSVAVVKSITNAVYNKIWVLLPDKITRKEIQWSGSGNELRCYKPTDSSPQQARILTSDTEMKTEIITAVSDTADGNLWYITVLPETLNDGDPVTVLDVLMTECGDLDTKFMDLDYVREHADENNDKIPDAGSEQKLQGLLPYAKVDVNRKESLLLQEFAPGPLGYESTTKFDVSTTITHYLRKNGGAVISFPYTPPAKTTKGWIWQSAK